jgi:hypothetical protein
MRIVYSIGSAGAIFYDAYLMSVHFMIMLKLVNTI